MTCVQNRVISVNPEATTYNIDERRQKDNDDGEDAHQGAVQPGLHDPFGKSLQRDWEKLGTTSRKISIMNGFDEPFPDGESARSSWSNQNKTKKTHAKTAVDSGDKHDGHEDDEATDEEAHYHIGTTGRKHGVIKYTRGTPQTADAHPPPPVSHLSHLIHHLPSL